MQFLQSFFKADVHIALAIALMVTASFHFFKSRMRATGNKRALEGYLKMCEAFDTLLHFICVITILAFGFTFGWIEMFKLMILCLVLPVINHLCALILGTKRWEFLASLVAMPIAIYCLWLVFPKLNWFGAL